MASPTTYRGTIAATGQSSWVTVKEGLLSIAGTWTGTVVIKADPGGDGTGVTLTDPDGEAYSYTGNATVVLDLGGYVPVRLDFTRSSGTVEYALVGG